MQRFCFQRLLKQRGSLTGSKSYNKIWYVIMKKWLYRILYDRRCLPLEQNTVLKRCVATNGTGPARTLMAMDRLTLPSRMVTKQMDLLTPRSRMATAQMVQLTHPSGTATMPMGPLTHPSGTGTVFMDHQTSSRMVMATCTEQNCLTCGLPVHSVAMWAPCKVYREPTIWNWCGSLGWQVIQYRVVGRWIPVCCG
jgi:hypothetical protein